MWRYPWLFLFSFVLALGGCMRPVEQPLPGPDRQPREELEELVVNSRPGGATAIFSTGERCQTPCRVTKSSAEPFSITIKKEGYLARTVRVTNNLETLREFNRHRAKGALNLDAIRVPRLRLVPNPVEVVLEPEWSKN